MTTVQPTIKVLELDSLVTDKRYQRPLHDRTVGKITRDFSIELCGALVVSARPNGVYAVFDGQHRLQALRVLGVDKWKCLVYEGLTPEEEAVLFVKLQTERRPVHPLDRHKALVFSGDENAIKINNLAEECGYRITDAKVHGALACVITVADCYRVYGPEHLRLALKILEEAWGLSDHYARKGPMVRGMTLLMAKHSKEMDLKSFVAKLNSISSSQIIRGANRESSLRRQTSWGLVARQLLDAYNAGRRNPTEEDLANGVKSRRISPNLIGGDE